MQKKKQIVSKHATYIPHNKKKYKHNVDNIPNLLLSTDV